MAKNKSEYELDKELAAVRSERNAKAEAGTLTVAEQAAYKAQIRALSAELQAILTAGAEGCPNCGTIPHGVHQPAVYDLRCLSPQCQKFTADVFPPYAKGRTVEEAVEKWNAGEFVIKQAGLVVEGGA